MLERIQRALFSDPGAVDEERQRLAKEMAALDSRRASLASEAESLQAEQDRSVIEKAQHALDVARDAIRRESERKRAAAEAERARALKAAREQFAKLSDDLASITLRMREAGDRLGAIEQEARALLLDEQAAEQESGRIFRDMQAARARMVSLGGEPDTLPPEPAPLPVAWSFYRSAAASIDRVARETPCRTAGWSALLTIADRARNYRA